MVEPTKDRNANVRQQLLKKRSEEAKRKVPLAPGEMVDDALARTVAATGRWLQKNVATVQWGVIATVALAIGYGVYDWRMDKRAQAASSDLVRASLDERGRVVSGTDNASKADDNAPPDPTPVFKSEQERRDAALASYREVAKKYPGTGPGLLARLGEAAILLDKRDWEGALSAYREVRASPLAAADVDVRGRSLEGMGFAQEGKGDAEGALKAFRELENTDVPGYKELGMYHQARLFSARGDGDKAKELLKSAHEKLSARTEGASGGAAASGGGRAMYSFLAEQVDDLLHRLDPTVAPAKGGGAGKQMTTEDIQRLQEQFQRRLKESQEKAQKGGTGFRTAGRAGPRIVVGAPVTTFLQGAGKAAGLVALAAVCVGCETVGGANPEVAPWTHRPNGALDVVFRRSLTAASRQSGEAYERGNPAIDPIHRRLFVGSADHGLYAVRAEDGQPLWRFETMGPVQSEALYEPHGDVVYFGSNDGALYKVRAFDGQLVWRFMSNAEVSRRPVLAHGLLYFVNANDTLVALDPATGKQRWAQHRTPALGMEVAGYAGPLVSRERVYTAFSDGHVGAYDPLDGSEKWPPVDLSAEAEQSGGGEVPRYLDVDTTPVLDTIGATQVVYVASYAGGVFALDAATGARVWANERATGVTELVLWQEPAHPPGDGIGPAVPARKALLASSGTTGLWALATDGGRELWRRPLPEGGVSAPAPIAGALLVSTTRYGLFLFSPLDGGVIDGLDLAGGLAMTPAAYGRRAFVMSNEGALLAVRVDLPGGT